MIANMNRMSRTITSKLPIAGTDITRALIDSLRFSFLEMILKGLKSLAILMILRN
jgi:hypothetical protein